MSWKIILVVFVGCLSSMLEPASAQSFTLQQMMSGTFNSELQASPKGSRVVWMANQEGKRNVWVADVGSGNFAARQLTAYTADDGQDIGDIAWTPDGRSVVYVYGGDFEFPGRPDPNPALLADGVEQTIFIVPVDGGKPRRVAAGRSPSVSSDGKTVAFLSKEGIWSVSLADDSPKPVLMFHVRGTLGPPMWSPDGRYVAFTSNRGDHGFIGVYSVGEKTITYMDPSTQMDRYPEWSPDSRQIAFVRTPGGGGGGAGARRVGEPWSIQIADAATGTGHEVWRAAKGQGSVFHPLGTDQQLFWTHDGNLVFPSEVDGWEHLYSVPVSARGGTAALLTPGDFEVEHTAMSPDRADLVFSSNQGDIDRRHVWQITANGKFGIGQLTKGDGIEVFPVMTATGSVVVLRADAQVPIRPALVASNGELRDLAPQLVPADYPAKKLVVPQQVILSASDGMKIHGQLFLPATASDGKRHPALVFFHGGSRRQMLLGYHYMDYYSNAYAMNQYLASLGYIVLSVNYRSGIGYGLNFREAINYGPGGASEYNDVQGAGLYMRSRADVDPARIGVWGGSYGGYLTALALARSSDLFAAGVDFHGVHDWAARLSQQPGSGDTPADPNVTRIAFESSPLASIKTWKSPVLLIQGDDDRNVAFSQTVRMAAALRAQGVEFEEHVFPDEIHGFLMHRSWVTAYGLTADFFGRHFGVATLNHALAAPEEMLGTPSAQLGMRSGGSGDQ